MKFFVRGKISRDEVLDGLAFVFNEYSNVQRYRIVSQNRLLDLKKKKKGRKKKKRKSSTIQ